MAKKPVIPAKTKAVKSTKMTKAQRADANAHADGHSMMADVERSGLDANDVKRMGLRELTAGQTLDLTAGKFGVPSYMIPYSDVAGVSAKFVRLRFLADVKMPGETKPIRYWQPPGTMPKAYFPRTGTVNWSTLRNDITKPIYITEGEKKAALACKAGITMIGLGGVWSWRSSKFGRLLLDDLEQFDWQEREVIVVFDSDLAENPNVQAALTQMGRVLLDRGAIVSSVCLTALDDGSKAGVDDWIKARGVDAFRDLPVEPLSESVELWKLNEEVALIRDNGGIVETATGTLYSKSTFCEIIYANRRFVRVTGEGKLKECSAPDEWLKWRNRREYKSITYKPGEGLVTSANELNTWKGWGAEPVKGDIAPFMAIFDYVTEGQPADVKKWLMQWFAYPIQHPGQKLYTSILLWGRTHGTGKSMLAVLVGLVYGQNYSMIGQQDLEGSFNDWAKGKQFILGEEVTSSDKRKDSDRMKFMTTRDVVWINEKYQPKYMLPDVTNYFFTSNHPDAFFVEPSDRRLLIIESPEVVGPAKIYTDAEKFRTDPKAASALAYHLMHVDCTGFNPRGHAPDTASKQEMISMSASDLDTFSRELIADPESVLRLLGHRAKTCDLYTAEELMELFDPGNMKRTTRIATAKALRRAGACPLDVTTVPILGSRKLYAIRNTERWRKASHAARAVHYGAAIGSVKRGNSTKTVTDIATKRKTK